MNPSITVELQFFLISILWGGILMLAYDVLRILRRMIPHDSFFIALEDFFFWVIGSLFIFAMIYKVNDGIIRGFSALGVVLGGVLYHYSISDFLVCTATTLLHILVKFIKVLLTPLRLAGQKLLKLFKLINKLLLRLKNKMKSVTIALSAKKQASKKKPATKKKPEAVKKSVTKKTSKKSEADRHTMSKARKSTASEMTSADKKE
jgi:spore cortex biosynthesis protein YabQ